jgi:hypothetical protein
MKKLHNKNSFLWLVALFSVLLSGCEKDYSVENIMTPISNTGTWQFTEGANFYSGTIDTAYISGTGTKTLHLYGASADKAYKYRMELFTTDSFKVGEYHTIAFENNFSFSSVSKTIYQTDPVSGDFVINIASVQNNQITGTFSGMVDDVNGDAVNLTSGKFSSGIDLTANSSSNNNATAMATLGEAAGICTPVAVAGTYTNGVTMDNSNSIQIQMNVISTGKYSVSTATVDGITFSKSGSFTATGVQTVTLTASGTPTSAGTQVFTITYGSSACSFALNVN